MELFTFIPYFLLLEREESDRNTLANANTEFIREVYEPVSYTHLTLPTIA